MGLRRFPLKKARFQRYSLSFEFPPFSAKIELTFDFTKEIPLKMNRTKKKGSPKNSNHLQFYKRNPLKFFVFNFTKEIPLKFLRKKINPEIWSQKYHLGPASWRSFLK